MKRRTLLAALGGAAVTLSGCLGSGGPDGDPAEASTTTAERTTESTPTDETTTETGDSTETTVERPETGTQTTVPTSDAVTDVSFEIQKETCGTGENDVTVDRSTGTITLEGTISGRNSCFTARVDRVDHDADAGTLTVRVRSFSEADEDQVCGQCLAKIVYSASISYDAPEPETVTVLHNDEQIYQS